MRRTPLLVLAAAVATPLFLSAPAGASVYCGTLVGPIQASGPVCTVKCALASDYTVDPSGHPPVQGLQAPCFNQD
jgi:hypothetical protein